MRTRAHVTVVNVSLPNFNGTRVATGRKYNSTRLTRTSVARRDRRTENVD
jgi:hypothetical protein